MKTFKQVAFATLLTLSLTTVSLAGTIPGSRTSGSRTGTITGSRSGTITGSRTGTITGSSAGTISGSRAGIIPTQNDQRFGFKIQGELVYSLWSVLSSLAW